MAGYNNFPSYGAYPQYPQNSYQQQYQSGQPTGYMGMGQSNNSYAAPQQQPVGIVWVDGEVGAKAYQLPAGWPVNAPMPLWDTNDTIIYLKSTNQMGMPNPIQKVRYTMEDQPRMSAAMQSNNQMLPSGNSYQDNQQAPDMSEYVRKDELNQMKEELKAAVTEAKGAKVSGKSPV